MSHPLTNQFINLLTQVTQLNFSEASSVKFMASLRDKLIFTGFNQTDAETLVGSLIIDVPPDSLDAEEIEQLAVLYCEILNKAHQALIDNGFQHPMLSLLKMSEKFSLKLS